MTVSELKQLPFGAADGAPSGVIRTKNQYRYFKRYVINFGMKFPQLKPPTFEECEGKCLDMIMSFYGRYEFVLIPGTDRWSFGKYGKIQFESEGEKNSKTL